MAMETKRLYISVCWAVGICFDFYMKFILGSSQFKLISYPDSRFRLDRDNMYNGRVFGETKSSVRAHIDNGVFTGSIVLPGETYHIEVSVF